MALVNQPPILASSFAVNGDKNTIPTTNSGTEGLASLSLGFPPITQQPVSQGGIPPQRADFNGIFNLITNFLMFIQNGSIFAYSSTLDYQPPAIVYGNNALYRCIATNGANTSAGVQPLSNTSYWQPLIPVGGITVSGNTITVTNGTGTQIQYTIDTITNPPPQSDSSNKIVTSAWVKTYAPSKTGVGASGTWSININGNSNTSNSATQDSQGQAINTTYVKGVTANNATITVTKGNGTNSTTTINNVAHATNADLATKATQDSQGQQINTTYVKSVTASNATLTITKGNGSTSTITVNNVNNAINANNSTSTAVFNLSYVGTRGVSGLSFSMEDSSNIMELLRISPNQENKAVLRIRSIGDYIQFLNCNNATQQNQLICNFPTSPTAPTPNTSDNSTKIATTAFVQSLLTNKFTANKTTNGWWKDGNTGMIYQWGVVKESSSSSDYKYFPISFPNSCFVVIGVINEYPVSDYFTPWAYPVDKTKFLIGAEKDYISVYNMGYIAIGY